ncbi:MAG: hypothetical protein QW303_00570 [Nitrososphaerota archaeon]
MKCFIKPIINPSAKERVVITYSKEIFIKILAKSEGNLFLLIKDLSKYIILISDEIIIDKKCYPILKKEIQKIFIPQLVNEDEKKYYVNLIYRHYLNNIAVPHFSRLNDPFYQPRIINYIRNTCGENLTDEFCLKIAEAIKDKIFQYKH